MGLQFLVRSLAARRYPQVVTSDGVVGAAAEAAKTIPGRAQGVEEAGRGALSSRQARSDGAREPLETGQPPHSLEKRNALGLLPRKGRWLPSLALSRQRCVQPRGAVVTQSFAGARLVSVGSVHPAASSSPVSGLCRRRLAGRTARVFARRVIARIFFVT